MAGTGRSIEELRAAFGNVAENIEGLSTRLGQTLLAVQTLSRNIQVTGTETSKKALYSFLASILSLMGLPHRSADLGCYILDRWPCEALAVCRPPEMGCLIYRTCR